MRCHDLDLNIKQFRTMRLLNMYIIITNRIGWRLSLINRNFRLLQEERDYLGNGIRINMIKMPVIGGHHSKIEQKGYFRGILLMKLVAQRFKLK